MNNWQKACHSQCAVGGRVANDDRNFQLMLKIYQLTDGFMFLKGLMTKLRLFILMENLYHHPHFQVIMLIMWTIMVDAKWWFWWTLNSSKSI